MKSFRRVGYRAMHLFCVLTRIPVKPEMAFEAFCFSSW